MADIINQPPNNPRPMNQPPYPAYGGNGLIMNAPYTLDNYMGRIAPQQSQPQMNNNIPNQYLRCRPVSSKEEAMAAQIDLDGSLWVFTDIGNDRIYTKKINNDGTASFITYKRIQEVNPYSGMSGDYITREEFNKVIQEIVAAMQVRDVHQPAAA